MGTVNPGLAAYQERKRQEKLAKDFIPDFDQGKVVEQPVIVRKRVKVGVPSRTMPYPDNLRKVTLPNEQSYRNHLKD